MSTTKLTQFRKRLANLWRVEPFRIEVPTDWSTNKDAKIQVDGLDATEEQMEILRKDIRECTKQGNKEKYN